MSVLTLEASKAAMGVGMLSTAKPPDPAVIKRLSVEDQVLLTKLLTEPVDFVAHESFSKTKTEKALFGGAAKLVKPSATRFIELPNRVADAASTGERIPALPAEDERHLFERFNYARFRVAKLLSECAGERIPSAKLRHLLAWGWRVLAARGVIVRVNMPLVLAMSKRTRLSSIDFNDLVSEGNMALLRSVEKFDSSRGFKFSTYSCRAILKSFSRVAMRVSRYRGTFPMEFDPSMERSDYVDRKRTTVIEDCVDELKDILLKNLAELSEVERQVIRERFAIGKENDLETDKPKTLEQVGNIIGVTKERVRQIQNKALKKIRGALEERYLAA